jgi:Fe-S-cluster-containing dehydrogenase component/DMSO reductase anchor subunit
MITLPIISERARASIDASGVSLVEQLLESQQSLSAVETFSHWHTNGHDSYEKNGKPRYSSLLPATPPGPGQQYAFEVDLDRCSGCKACVAACHTLNGLDETETWRDVGLLVGGTRTAPVMQHVTAACHHCLQPACMIACPVNAYEKDPVTGIVKHLDDQCFGCQYCTMACPYDVPKYHPGKGIVRKCDMCSSRLAVGEAPACVQACPHEAIRIQLVNVAQVIDDVEAAVFLPAAPDPQITQPTTTYKSTRPFPRNLLPADYFSVNREHAHWPLVVMLVLTQLSVGAFVAGLALDHWLPQSFAGALRPLHAVEALAFGLIALAASLLHLGRPQLAFRAVLGLRHSWLSREIVAFGAFAGLASLYAACVFVEPSWSRWLSWAVAASGGVAVFCSVMIYVFTQRECWSFLRVAVRFALTAAMLGVAALWLSILVATLSWPSAELVELVGIASRPLCVALVAITATKLLFEAEIFRHLLPRRMTPLRRSAMLMGGELSNVTLARFAAGLLGGALMPCFLLSQLDQTGLAQFAVSTGLLFLACLVGELLERYLFFAACAAPRMPGGPR